MTPDIAFTKNKAVWVLTYPSEYSINRFIMAGFSRIIWVKPSISSEIILSIILNNDLKDGDFSQNPNVKLWQRGRSSLFMLWSNETILAKKLEKLEADKLL